MRDLEKKKEWCRNNYRKYPEESKQRVREWEHNHPDKRNYYTAQYRKTDRYKVLRQYQQQRARMRNRIKRLFGEEIGLEIINQLQFDDLLKLNELTVENRKDAKIIISNYIASKKVEKSRKNMI